jgi:hypothetical protein
VTWSVSQGLTETTSNFWLRTVADWADWASILDAFVTPAIETTAVNSPAPADDMFAMPCSFRTM